MRVIVNITGSQEEIARFKRLGSKLNDFSGAMKDIGTELTTYYGKTVMQSEGGAIGKRWQALSPAYKHWKGRHYPGMPILTASGELAKDFKADSTSNSVTIYNTRKTKNGRSLLEIHQLGLGHNPVRPILVETKAAGDIVQEVVENDVKTKLAAA